MNREASFPAQVLEREISFPTRVIGNHNICKKPLLFNALYGSYSSLGIGIPLAKSHVIEEHVPGAE
jgi:hypothetical protein